MPNAILINNVIQDKGIRIASANIAVKNNQFILEGIADYALEYYLANEEESQLYELYLYGNEYQGNYKAKEKIVSNNEILRKYTLEIDIDRFIRKVIGE